MVLIRYDERARAYVVAQNGSVIARCKCKREAEELTAELLEKERLARLEAGDGDGA